MKLITFKVDEKVRVKDLDKEGIVRQVVDGKPKLVEIDGELRDVTDMIVEKIVEKFLHKALGWIWKKIGELINKD